MIKKYEKELKIYLLLLIVYMVTSLITTSYYEKQKGIILEENKKIYEEKEDLNIELLNANKKIESLESEIDKLLLEIESIKIPNLVSLGEFKLTAYCKCNRCCGRWSGGLTASGTEPTENRTIAVDKSLIPFGTKIIINGKTYVAEDTGSSIKGNRIDIYMESHEAALKFGVQYAEVFMIAE